MRLVPACCHFAASVGCQLKWIKNSIFLQKHMRGLAWLPPACVFVCLPHASKISLRKLAAHCIPCRRCRATRAVRATAATAACPNQISNRAAEIGYAANQNCANCVFVCKKKRKKNCQKRGKVAGKMKGKLNAALEGRGGRGGNPFLAAHFAKRGAHNIG